MEFYDLSYAFLKLKIQKRCIIFSTGFLFYNLKRRQKKLCVLCVYLYYDLYYVTVLCIVLSKHYMIMVKKKKEMKM